MSDSKEELFARLRIKMLENKRKKPFNSDDMSQVPFDFFEDEEYSLRHMNAETRTRIEFAKKYFNKSCGYLHLSWDVDAYWSMVANQVMVPYVSAIYKELVRRGHDEKNPCMYGDADGDIFWIPAKNPNTKVVVHTNQSRDYLYILTELKPLFKGAPPLNDFHIRRIWRKADAENYTIESLEDLYGKVINDPGRSTRNEKLPLEAISKEEFINTILQNVSSYEEIADDHYKYSRRHSLEYYRSRDFDMGLDYKKAFNGIYADARDGGFVISLGSRVGREAENTVKQFPILEMIATCYLPSIANHLELNVETDWDRNND